MDLIKKLLESTDIRGTLLEDYTINPTTPSSFPTDRMAIDDIFKYSPKELDPQIYAEYEQQGLIKDGAWSESSLINLFKTSIDDFIKLYDVVSETRYSQAVLPTVFQRKEPLQIGIEDEK